MEYLPSSVGYVEETFVSGEIVVDTEADLTSLTEESQSCGSRGDATTGV